MISDSARPRPRAFCSGAHVLRRSLPSVVPADVPVPRPIAGRRGRPPVRAVLLRRRDDGAPVQDRDEVSAPRVLVHAVARGESGARESGLPVARPRRAVEEPTRREQVQTVRAHGAAAAAVPVRRRVLRPAVQQRGDAVAAADGRSSGGDGRAEGVAGVAVFRARPRGRTLGRVRGVRPGEEAAGVGVHEREGGDAGADILVRAERAAGTVNEVGRERPNASRTLEVTPTPRAIATGADAARPRRTPATAATPSASLTSRRTRPRPPPRARRTRRAREENPRWIVSTRAPPSDRSPRVSRPRPRPRPRRARLPTLPSPSARKPRSASHPGTPRARSTAARTTSTSTRRRRRRRGRRVARKRAAPPPRTRRTYCPSPSPATRATSALSGRPRGIRRTPPRATAKTPPRRTAASTNPSTPRGRAARATRGRLSGASRRRRRRTSTRGRIEAGGRRRRGRRFRGVDGRGFAARDFPRRRKRKRGGRGGGGVGVGDAAADDVVDRAHARVERVHDERVVHHGHGDGRGVGSRALSFVTPETERFQRDRRRQNERVREDPVHPRETRGRAHDAQERPPARGDQTRASRVEKTAVRVALLERQIKLRELHDPRGREPRRGDDDFFRAGDGDDERRRGARIDAPRDSAPRLLLLRDQDEPRAEVEFGFGLAVAAAVRDELVLLHAERGDDDEVHPGYVSDPKKRNDRLALLRGARHDVRPSRRRLDDVTRVHDPRGRDLDRRRGALDRDDARGVNARGRVVVVVVVVVVRIVSNSPRVAAGRGRQPRVEHLPGRDRDVVRLLRGKRFGR
eukprot:30782-Pelagococcus_subviridis.AAC.4